MPKKHKRNKQSHVLTSNIPKLDALEQINLNAAGLDIGDAEIYVAVPEGRDHASVKVFKTFTADLEALADWLSTCDIETVAMEATGVYWIPVYDLLEERGFEVYLVNARHLKKVSGRKTDVLDCQWLQQLHTYGLLKASFRPPEEIAALRALVRHRGNLVQSAARETHHMQKALQQMNLKLTNVISDITGVTGMAILRDIVAGERDPHVLARHRHTMCTKSEEEIAQALQGHYRAEHIFALQQALEAHDFYQRQLRVCDVEIEKRCASLESQVDLAEKPLPPARRPLRKPKGNAPDFDLRTYLYQMAGVDLTRIDGLDALSVLKILSEIGVDMTRWPTAKHFTAWLGVCPHEDKTGGKVKKTRTRKTQNRAAAALRMVAQTLAHSQSTLGAYYRHMRARLGAPEAVTATAHKLARIIYAMLKNKTEYHDLGEEAYEEQVRERALHSLKRKAAKLGFDLVDSRPRSALA